jgi:hypothetical protein
MPHERELLPGRVFGKREYFHARRNAKFGLSVLHEIEDCRLLAARHPDGGSGISRRFAACAGAGATASGLSHDGLLNNVTVFNSDGEGGVCKAMNLARSFA